MKAKTVSCGVLVSDGERLLLGHATRSPRWDIPKGIAEPGEDLVAAARRELFEETGLQAPVGELRSLGVFRYRAGKDLALFAWPRPVMPEPEDLVCRSYFDWNGRRLPELDRFGVFRRDEALARVGKSLAALLAGISFEALRGASE